MSYFQDAVHTRFPLTFLRSPALCSALQHSLLPRASGDALQARFKAVQVLLLLHQHSQVPTPAKQHGLLQMTGWTRCHGLGGQNGLMVSKKKIMKTASDERAYLHVCCVWCTVIQLSRSRCTCLAWKWT